VGFLAQDDDARSNLKEGSRNLNESTWSGKIWRGWHGKRRRGQSAGADSRGAGAARSGPARHFGKGGQGGANPDTRPPFSITGPPTGYIQDHRLIPDVRIDTRTS